MPSHLVHAICRVAACVLLATLAMHNSPARGQDSALHDQLLADARDGQLGRHTLLQAALIAGGVDNRRELRKYEARVTRLAADCEPASNAGQIAETTFEYLHDDILTGEYSLECSSVAEALDSGQYNCLSGTLLFMELARRRGLRVVAVAAENHVLCREASNKTAYVESTCPKWYTLPKDQRIPRDPHADDSTPEEDLRDLTDVQLIAKVYYNRGVSLLRAGHFRDGLRHTQIAVQLDPADDTAHGNLLAGLNNWALKLTSQGKFEQALDRLDELEQHDATYKTLRDNRWHIYSSWANRQIQRGDAEIALKTLKKARPYAPSPEVFDTAWRQLSSQGQSATIGNREENPVSDLTTGES